MKKIILLTLLPITIVMAGSFIMTKGDPLIKTVITSSPSTDSNPENTKDNPTTISNWTPKLLPTQKFNVLNYGLKGDGVTDDTRALNTLAKNTNVTNWYFPAGKTFRLYGVIPPAHLTTVWGGGTLKTIYSSDTYPLGVFKILNRPTTSLLIDNINFTYVKKDYENGEYGAIMIAKGNTADSVQNVEIRNSSFTGNSECPANGITIYGKSENGGTKHVNIHNNKFIDIPRAGVEILHRSNTPTTDGDGIEDVNVFKNSFDFTNSGGWKCAISYSQVRKPCLVANNRLNHTSWDVEINQAVNITIRNNYSTNCKQHFISQGTSGWHGNDVFDVGENIIRNNHFESQTATIHIYDGSKSKYYDNFIAGGIWSQQQKDGWGASIGEFYNNTIVKDSTINAYAGKWTGPASAIKIESNGYDTNIHDNDIYIKHNGSTGIIMVSSVGTDTYLTNNNIQRTGTNNNCISTGTSAVISKNTCIANYSNNIPTSISKAGLE